MAVYSELIKNFEKIREYVRDFYIFGFHTRESFDAKSKYLCRWIRGTFFKTHCISAIVQRPLRTMISVCTLF